MGKVEGLRKATMKSQDYKLGFRWKGVERRGHSVGQRKFVSFQFLSITVTLIFTLQGFRPSKREYISPLISSQLGRTDCAYLTHCRLLLCRHLKMSLNFHT